jgi:glycosyltransferase involved in cell wall biosynthesis
MGREVSAPLVTIGITCFNAADTIARAVGSALAQDWPNLEVVIVDDFSADGSTDVVMSAIEDEPRAKLIRHSCNLGPAAARNTILSEAGGEFIAFFDDDDESLTGRISNQVRTLAAYEQRIGVRLIACYASGMRRYPNGYNLALPAIGSRGEQVPNGPEVADYLLIYRRRSDWFYGSGTPACSLLARRSTFVAVGDFDSELRRVEDADFAIRLGLMGGHFVGTHQILFVQHSTNASDKSPERNLEAQQRLACKHKAYLESVGSFEYAKRWSRLRYWHFSRRYGRFVLEFLGLLLRYPVAATWHLLNTGPRRLWHERRMRQDSACGW